MESKKINPARSDYLMVGAILAVAAILYSLLAAWDGDLFRICSTCILFLPFSIAYVICGLCQRSYYVFTANGIDVYRRPDKLLTTIRWQDVRSYSVMMVNQRSYFPYYLVLVMSADATVDGQPAITCSGEISPRKAKPYLLHRFTEKLARGKITTEEFRQQEVYFVDVTKEQLEMAKKLRRQGG